MLVAVITLAIAVAVQFIMLRVLFTDVNILFDARDRAWDRFKSIEDKTDRLFIIPSKEEQNLKLQINYIPTTGKLHELVEPLYALLTNLGYKWESANTVFHAGKLVKVKK
jgi:hypothetical protein